MFDLREASEGSKSTGSQYQTVGIYDNVKVSDVLLEKTSKAFVPFLRLVTEGPNGEKGSSAKMFLSTEKKEGKKTSGWGVTARNLTDIIMSTHNVDEETAQGMIDPSTIKTYEQLQQKVSALLVGKPFRAKFKGETTAKGNIFAVLAQTESLRKTPTSMKFDPTRDIKPYEGAVQSVGSSAAINDDMPF